MIVYLLSIHDMANFSKLEHRSIVATREQAELLGRAIVRDLIERDRHHGLGDTFAVDIEEYTVQG